LLPYLDAGKAILEIAKTLFGIKDTLAKTSLDQKIRIADYIDKISGCLLSISNKFTGDDLDDQGWSDQGWRQFTQECASLHRYLKDLPEVLHGKVDNETSDTLHKLLDHCRNIRTIIAHYSEGEAEDRILRVIDPASARASARVGLETTAGYFKAVADRLRI
jgi:hypothetical protein